MNDNFQVLFDLHFSDWSAFLRSQFAWSIPFALTLLALLLLRPWALRRRAERRIRDTISALGTASVSEVSLDNGLEGFVFIDHLVLTPREILVITLLQIRGIVFGAEKIDNWSSVLGRRTFKFTNPVVASNERVLAVRDQVPEVPVRGIVIFGEGCTFPKGKPEGTMQIEEIAAAPGQESQATVPASLQAAWDKLMELASRGEELYARDVLLLRDSPSRVREFAAIALFTLALAWTGWRLFAS